jgi:hypothetical protein
LDTTFVVEATDPPRFLSLEGRLQLAASGSKRQIVKTGESVEVPTDGPPRSTSAPFVEWWKGAFFTQFPRPTEIPPLPGGKPSSGSSPSGEGTSDDVLSVVLAAGAAGLILLLVVLAVIGWAVRRSGKSAPPAPASPVMPPPATGSPTPPVQFCPYCGQTLPPQSSFCTGCGRPIPSTPVTVVAPQSVQPAVPSPDSGSRLLAAGLCFAVVAPFFRMLFLFNLALAIALLAKGKWGKALIVVLATAGVLLALFAMAAISRL